MASKSRKSEPSVLRYAGRGRFRGVPARDLTAHDLNRLAYRKALTVTGSDGIRPDPAKPDPDLVKQITAELIGSGLYQPED